MRDRDRTEVDGEGSLPEPEVQYEAAKHSRGGTGFGGEFREGAEQEDAEQAAIGDGGDREADFDHVSLAAYAHGVHGDSEEYDGPEGSGGFGEQHALAACGVGAGAHVEVDDGGGGQGVQGGGEVGHSGSEDGGDEEAGDADGHLADNEGRKDVVVGAEGRGGMRTEALAVEHPEPGTDEQEKRELREDDHAGAEQSPLRLAQIAGGEQALHHELIGAVGGHGEKGAAEQAGPEGVALGEVQGEVEHAELVGGLRHMGDGSPTAGDVVTEREQSDQRAADIDRHLRDIGPDNRGHAAFKGVKQGEGGDQGDGGDVAGADGDADHDGDRKDADAFGGGAGEQKETRGDLVQQGAEAAVDELVGGEHFSGEVAGQKEQRDNHTAGEVPEHHL